MNSLSFRLSLAFLTPIYTFCEPRSLCITPTMNNAIIGLSSETQMTRTKTTTLHEKELGHPFWRIYGYVCSQIFRGRHSDFFLVSVFIRSSGVMAGSSLPSSKKPEEILLFPTSLHPHPSSTPFLSLLGECADAPNLLERASDKQRVRVRVND
ncbi:hypothetical protein F5880DRAFT_1116066 [Lentinula raphanica]|nr:hypothetical protein F5880DRAFT_1116066 [Lentinula raphanica]